jgi:pimeloyl-ACP methyl ester carboxylesterase
MAELVTTTMQGINVRLHVAGDGPALLFLHGAAGSDWRPPYDAMARHFKVYLPEHPGFGVTERPDWLDTVQDLAIWTIDLIDHLGLAPVYLAGHSLGGWTAAELASLCSHQLRKLVLIDPAGLRIPGEERLDLFLASPEEAAHAVYHHADLAQRLLQPPESPEAQRAAIRNRNMTARLGWNPYFYDPRLEARLRRVGVPTLIVWGKQDGLIPVSHAEQFRQRIPGATVAIIDACGHVPMVEQTDEFVRILAEFLAE